MALWIITVKKTFHLQSKTRFTICIFFSVPPGNFTREGVEQFIVYTAALETIKFFWSIGFIFLVVSRLQLLKNYKMQPDDHVQWKKLPKVCRQVSGDFARESGLDNKSNVVKYLMILNFSLQQIS